MHEAAYDGRSPVVELLLDQQGIEVNQADRAGQTALHVAAKRGHTNVLMLLVNFPGINLAATNCEGETFLHKLAAKANCDPETLRNLLGNLDVDPNVRNLKGNTPIMELLLSNSNHNNVAQCLRAMVQSDRVDILCGKARHGGSLVHLLW